MRPASLFLAGQGTYQEVSTIIGGLLEYMQQRDPSFWRRLSSMKLFFPLPGRGLMGTESEICSSYTEDLKPSCRCFSYDEIRVRQVAFVQTSWWGGPEGWICSSVQGDPSQWTECGSEKADQRKCRPAEGVRISDWAWHTWTYLPSEHNQFDRLLH